MIILDRKYTGFEDPTWTLNPFQELADPYKDTMDNVLAVAPTSSGKSTLITMFGHKFIGSGKKIVYSGTMKALVEEKINDWAEDHHPWKDVRKVAISGDYMYDDKAAREALRAEVISITPEALISKLRNINSEKSAWLKSVGLLVIDEVHLVGDNSRGANLEAALIEFTHEFPEVQLVCLSATVPNSGEMAKWLTKLTNKEIRLIVSDYRPVPLTYNFIPIQSKTKMGYEDEVIAKSVELMTAKNNEQFMFAVFKKTFGTKATEVFERQGIPSAFHNANHTKSERNKIEKNFKSGLLRTISSTSTLFTGVNLPARNVIVSNAETGYGDIDTFTLQQCAGRAGRPKYDDQGFVYFMLPAAKFEYHKQRITVGEDVRSCMHRVDQLATHFLGAVYLKRINTIGEFMAWYDRTLAHTQNQWDSGRCTLLLNSVLQDLKRRGMLTTDEDTGAITLRRRGIICAQLMLDPYIGFELISNFRSMFDLNSISDVDIAKAIGCCEAFKTSWLDPHTKSKIPGEVRTTTSEEFQKIVTAITMRMSGKDVPYEFLDVYLALYKDIDRLEMALVRFNDESEMWKNAKFIQKAFIRIKRGLTWDQANLALSKLKNHEIRSLERSGVVNTVSDSENAADLVKSILSTRSNYGKKN